ncbi:MAG: DUF2341 domain-containing protein [Kiritimatiellae bacterium]|nr:DUF2341 domain-containing protein [Kiritimatiellia bacterium]
MSTGKAYYRNVFSEKAEVFVLTAFVLAAVTFGAEAKSCRLVFSGYEGKETLKDFPALVKIPDGLTGFDYAEATADGSDITFFSTDGTRLAHEIDTWDPDGTSYVWVRVPELTKATAITAKWGESRAKTSMFSPRNVWDDDYLAVWHFSKFRKGVTLDSKNGLAAELRGKDVRKFIHADGLVGKSYFSSSQTTTSGPYLQVAKDDRWTAYGKTGKLTVSFLMNSTIPRDKSDWGRIISTKPFKGHPRGFEVVAEGGSALWLCGQFKTNLEYNVSANYGNDLYSFRDGWAHVTVVYDGAEREASIYYNGRLGSRERNPAFAPTVSDWPLAIGHYGDALRLEPQGHECFFCGYIDEVRLSKAALSPDRIRADYLTLTRPTQFAVAEGGKAKRILARRLAEGDTPPEVPDVGSWRGANVVSMFLAPWSYADPFIHTLSVEEDEFALLEKCGLNFARLPIDYRFVLSPDDWEHWLEDGLAKIDAAVEYGRRHHIHVMLCLYRAPGFSVYHLEAFKRPMTLNADPRALVAFKRIWREFARRYKGIPNSELSFNPVNEPIQFSTEQYVKVFGETIDEIRKEDPNRLVMLDGNGCGRVPVAHFFSVPFTGQCFRGYEPGGFTHYGVRGHFAAVKPYWPKDGNDKAMQWVPQGQAKNNAALDCIPKGYPVMIGEFGCFAETDHESTLKFMENYFNSWRERGYGWAIWDYDSPFGFVDSGRPDAEYIEVMGRKVDKKMLELLRRK